uniref:PCIF1 WW domain-containing protein n=1 Tax=viral metagenome TaxID=1070528 RepID=A0A6C0J4Z4_9ZZZZ
MNNELVKHLNRISQLKLTFHRISKLHYESESMKIWARWIITHRGLFTSSQKSILLPDDEVYDTQLIQELIDKGCPHNHAKYLHKWLWEQTISINKNYQMTAEVEYGGIRGIEPVMLTPCYNNRYCLKCGNINTYIKISAYDKLAMSLKNNSYLSNINDINDINGYIWLTNVLYTMLDGKGLQWAVPQQLMLFLKQQLNCTTELFASPINHYYDKYYSLFEMDRIYGSKGNFFTAKDNDFKEGCFQINPPFIDSLFTKTSLKILNLLKIANNNRKKLTFVYIMPIWKDFPTYTMVTDSHFCVKSITLSADKHSYYEYSTHKYIRARFNTAVIFLSTDDKICNKIYDDTIRRLFNYK